MHYGLRQRFRRVLETLTETTRVLPWLGFGKPTEPPTEPAHRSDATAVRGEAAAELHEQQHVDPGKRVEIDKPNI